MSAINLTMAARALFEMNEAQRKAGKRKKVKQANATNTMGAVLKSNEMKFKCSESAHFLETLNRKPKEGCVTRVILISEGLGNRRNMNYYGPEAINSAPAIFEGKPCFINHPSESEETDIPERRVQDKCGYFKNVKVETIDGLLSCTGELHFDLSEVGEQAYQKALTALHYREEFPGLQSEYVGLSVNAGGDTEQRTMPVENETLDVNYVTRFTDATSCDIVTIPARGGKFLAALVESAAGAMFQKKKEVTAMTVKGLTKSLEAARTALKKALEATKDEDEKSAIRASIVEANRVYEELLKEAAKVMKKTTTKTQSYQSEDDGTQADEADEDDGDSGSQADEDDGTQSDEDDGESKSDVAGNKGDIGKKSNKKGKAPAGPVESDEDDSESDEDDSEAAEANRIAVKHLLKESGLSHFDFLAEEYSALKLKEAKRRIAHDKRFAEACVRHTLKRLGQVPSAVFGKVNESDRSDAQAQNNDLFAEVMK